MPSPILVAADFKLSVEGTRGRGNDIAPRTLTEIFHFAVRVERELGSNIYQIVGGNPSWAIRDGMTFCRLAAGISKD